MKYKPRKYPDGQLQIWRLQPCLGLGSTLKPSFRGQRMDDQRGTYLRIPISLDYCKLRKRFEIHTRGQALVLLRSVEVLDNFSREVHTARSTDPLSLQLLLIFFFFRFQSCPVTRRCKVGTHGTGCGRNVRRLAHAGRVSKPRGEQQASIHFTIDG
jgi:hypothetical protein